MDSFNDGIYVHGNYVSKCQLVRQYRATLFLYGLGMLVVYIGLLMVVVSPEISDLWASLASAFATGMLLVLVSRYLQVRKRLFVIAPEYEHTNRSDIRRARRASLNNHDLPPPD